MKSFSEKTIVATLWLFIISSSFAGLALIFERGIGSTFVTFILTAASMAFIHFSVLGLAVLRELKKLNTQKNTFRLPPHDCD